jgi:hypothetical protein
MIDTAAHEFIINASWDAEAGVWLATSDSIRGLVVEAESWPQLLQEISYVLPDLLELNGLDPQSARYTVRAESRVSLTAA